ncbi:M24 family metallopeptidase [Hyalangium versicolor]|uniref:M24 family metallopeptidase n=1 Tax=Hyalangium versicolor TaxID=2861190 RepID=UPI001CC9BDD7|nr:M24 family metallopeptidase [Hyalangium versicolor]
MRTSSFLLASLLLSSACATSGARTAPSSPEGSESVRPFGTMRSQAERQQAWLKERLEVALPRLMRQHGVEMWVVPMREYNEDPVFKALVSATAYSARRRTIFVFHDMGPDKGVVRLTLGGGSQGGLYEQRRPAAKGGSGRPIEPWGPDQWQMLKQVLEERQPKSIAINVSRTFAFADGLTHGEYEGMTEALGPQWAARLKPSGGLPVDLMAWRTEDEGRFFADENKLAWNIIETAFSNAVITPGVTRVSDVEWWMRQRLADLGLDTWFPPSVEVQRQGATEEQLGEDPIIQRGDVLHCDFGITALRLNTDTQHMGYVLREGETDVPAGLKQALAASNRLQDLLVEELRPGRTGNEVLRIVLGRMQQEGINGSVYSHPVGLNGHGAGSIVGLWDRQEGVPGNGDHTIIPSMWYSVELQATSPVAEWGGQPVRSAQEEDVIIGADGRVRWAYQRQSTFHLVR